MIETFADGRGKECNAAPDAVRIAAARLHGGALRAAGAER